MAKAKDERKQLENILYGSSNTNDLGGNVMSDVDSDTIVPQELFEDDVNTLQKECLEEAKKIITQAVRHIFTKDMIRDNAYIKDKMKIDIESLGGMLYQNRSAVIMQKALMNEVKAGAASPRYFEVFAIMNKSIAENNKQLLATVEAIKATYQGIRVDIHEKAEFMSKCIGTSETTQTSNMIGDGGVNFTADGGVSSMGSKEMIKLVKNAVNQVRTSEE